MAQSISVRATEDTAHLRAFIFLLASFPGRFYIKRKRGKHVGESLKMLQQNYSN